MGQGAGSGRGLGGPVPRGTSCRGGREVGAGPGTGIGIRAGPDPAQAQARPVPQARARLLLTPRLLPINPSGMPPFDGDALLKIHQQLLERRRHALNLVGPGPLEPHYADCAGALGALSPSGHWADLGSGAGFPGIPFAARFPEVAIDLVESRQKRCVFLESVLLEATAELTARPAPVRVLCSRFEGLPSASYDGVVSRAVAAEELFAAAGPLLKPGGSLVLFLQGQATPPKSGRFSLVRLVPYAVAGLSRQVAVFHKA